MKKRIIPLLCFIWDAARYVVVMRILQVLFNPLQDPEYGFLIFWVSSYAFVVLVGLLLGGIHPARYYPVGRIIGIAKLMQALAAALFVLYDYGVVPVLLNMMRPGSVQISAALLLDFIPLIISAALIDIASGLALLFWRGGEVPAAIPVHITDLEED